MEGDNNNNNSNTNKYTANYKNILNKLGFSQDMYVF
jgi:hypothetical protein